MAETLRPAEESHYELKGRIHRQLIEGLDLSKVALLPADMVQQQIRRIVEDLLAGEETPLNRQEREQIVVEVQHETFGLGPIEPLMQDPTVSDILVNGPRSRVRGTARQARAHDGDLPRRRPPDAGHRAHRLGGRPARRRVVADGRRPPRRRLSRQRDHPPARARRPRPLHPPLRHRAVEDVRSHRAGHGDPGDSPNLLAAIVHARLNILVSGGTGAGKTTLLNVLSNAIPTSERIVTIEDSAELQLQQDHVVRLETRPANVEGTGRRHPAGSRPQRAAHAARPHHRRRGPWRRGRSTCCRR